MMMNSKVAVYTVLAVALGYLIISTVPATFLPQEREILLTEDEKPAFAAAPSEPEIKRAEASSTEKSSVWNEASQISYLIIDLLIAFGIYMVARRRFG